MKDIDKILNNVKSSSIPEFPFSDSQVRTVIENVDSKNNFQIIKKGAIIMTFLISLVAFMLYLGVDSASDLINNKQSNFLDSQTKIITQLESTANIDNEQQKEESTFNQNNQQTSDIKKQSKIYDIAMNEVQADAKNVFTIFIPDKSEMDKLFIRKTNCGYVIMTEENYPINQFKVQMEQIYKNNYPKKGYKRAIQVLNFDDIQEIGIANYTGWEMDNSAGIFPIMAKLINIDKKFKNTRRFLSKASPGPIDISELSDIVNSKFLRFIHNTLEKLDDKNAGNELKITYNKDENEYLSQVSIVLLDLDNDSTSSFWLLVYPNTRNFVKLLPNRFNKESDFDLFSDFGMDYNESEINSEINLAINNLDVECKNKINEIKQNAPKTVSKISGIEKIILTNEEAKQIGINIEKSIISFEAEEYSDLSVLPDKIQTYIQTEFNYNTTGFALLKERIEFDMNNTNNMIKPVVQKYSGWEHNLWSNISPACITVNRTLQIGNIVSLSQIFQSPHLVRDSAYYYLNSDDIIVRDSLGKYKAKIPNLIPVNFKEISYNNNGDSIVNNIDIWYVITREFANRLPNRYKLPLIKELDLLSNIENGSTTIDDACEVLKGEKSYLGICEIQGELSILNIFPNPITESTATIKFILKSDKKLKIELFNSNGELLETVKDYSEYNTGINSVNLEFFDLSKGVVLISLTDESNQRAIIKAIKN